MARWRVQSIGCVALAAALGLAACGGVSERRADGDGDGKGGTRAAGGTGATGGTNATGGDGATSGTPATGGVSGVGGTGSGLPCAWDGVVYPDGSSFPADDGCNACYCDDGNVSCTLIGCPPSVRCDEIAAEYAGTIPVAKQCDPNVAGSCNTVLASAIACGCPTTASYGPAVDKLGTLLMEASELGCGRGITCGACASGNVYGVCSTQGICMDVPIPDDCDALREAYHEAFARADRCETTATNQCQELASFEPGCGCETHVNSSAELRQLSLAWSMMACGNDVPCEPCPAPAPASACSGDGTCIDAYPQ